MPPPLDGIGRRRFAFYPSIWNLEPNEWMLSSATWVDAQVVNARTGQQVTVPRRYIGAVSETDDPILIVGLTKELEYREDALWPRVRRVIEMPLAVNESRPFRISEPRPDGPAPVVGIRLETRDESRASKLITTAGIGAVVVSLLVVGVFSTGLIDGRPGAHPAWQTTRVFTERDDYASITHKLGSPVTDRLLSMSDGSRFRALGYPAQHMVVILMETRQHNEARYLGTMNTSGRVLYTIPRNQGLNPEDLLASLPASLRH